MWTELWGTETQLLSTNPPRHQSSPPSYLKRFLNHLILISFRRNLQEKPHFVRNYHCFFLTLIPPVARHTFAVVGRDFESLVVRREIVGSKLVRMHAERWEQEQEHSEFDVGTFEITGKSPDFETYRRARFLAVNTLVFRTAVSKCSMQCKTTKWSRQLQLTWKAEGCTHCRFPENVVSVKKKRY